MGYIKADKKILTLLFFVIAAGALAQERSYPVFNYKNVKSGRMNTLYYFLSTFAHVRLDECLYATGTFRFKPSSTGKIGLIVVTGNLPDTLIYTIKKRIKETEQYWNFSNRTSEHNRSKWFSLSVFVSVNTVNNCQVDPDIENKYLSIAKLFENENQIITTPTSYLIYPIFWSGVK